MDRIIDELYSDFMEQYSFVCLEKKYVKEFYEKFKSTNVDMLYDYIMSNGLEEEVVL